MAATSETTPNLVTKERSTMPISHELSGEIATALFSGEDRSPDELDDLREIVLSVHSTLEQLTRDERAARMESFSRHSEIRKAGNAG